MDVKAALRDSRFRASLSNTFQEDIQKYLQNPGCACNLPFYKKVMTEAKEALQAYFPNRSVANLDEDAQKLAENSFSVINCKIDELENKLRSLPKGRKQIAITRYEDQITCIVNELDIIF